MSKKPQRAPVLSNIVRNSDGSLEADWTPSDETAYANPQSAIPNPQSPTTSLCKCIAANLAEDAEGYKTNHVELRLTSTEAVFLARLRAGLTARHAQLADGKHIETPPQALRWLLQKIMQDTTQRGS